MASSNSQIDKPQHGCPKRAELPDVNINTGVQSINTESLFNIPTSTFSHIKIQSTVNKFSLAVGTGYKFDSSHLFYFLGLQSSAVL